MAAILGQGPRRSQRPIGASCVGEAGEIFLWVSARHTRNPLMALGISVARYLLPETLA
jgi:hypothetical protein